MRFQPSAYSDVAAVAPPTGATGASSDLTSAAIQAGGQAISLGLDAWQRAADAKSDKWSRAAAKKAKKAKKARADAEAKRAAAVAMTTMPGASLPAPLPTTALSPLLKWGLIAGGVGIVGFAIYMITREKAEPKARHNPKRIHVKAKPSRRAPSVRPAATELAPYKGHDEDEGRDEDEGYGEGEDVAEEEDE